MQLADAERRLRANTWKVIIKTWRWDLVTVSLLALVFGIATTAPSAYFLHYDTPTQDGAALSWVNGSWEWTSEKILPTVLLGAVFRVFGPNPHWETLLLLAAAAVNAALVYELARLVSRSRLAGVVAVLLLASLPAYQYFSRTYLGHPIPFLLLAWYAFYRRWWGRSGVCFGLAVTAHFAALLAIGFSLLALAVFHLRPPGCRGWLAFCMAAVVPPLVAEAMFLAYNGIPFQWSGGMVANLMRVSDLMPEPNSNWLWVVQSIVGSNGWPLSGFLALGILAPAALRHNRGGPALSLAFLGVAVFYVFQAGLTSAVLGSKVFALYYPFWAICSGTAAMWLLGKLPGITLRRISVGIVLSGLGVALMQTGVFIREFAQTTYPEMEEAMRRAAETGRPVRHMGGNYWGALFFAQMYGVETLTGDYRWAYENDPGQAVLIFEGEPPETLSRDGYIVTMTETSDAVDARYPVLTETAVLRRHFELWWPTRESSPLNPQLPLPVPAVHYSGTGGITPPQYGYGTMHFYQLVWHKLLTRLHLADQDNAS